MFERGKECVRVGGKIKNLFKDSVDLGKGNPAQIQKMKEIGQKITEVMRNAEKIIGIVTTVLDDPSKLFDELKKLTDPEARRQWLIDKLKVS